MMASLRTPRDDGRPDIHDVEVRSMVLVRPRANRSALLAIVITWAFGLATAHVLCSRDATARRLQDKTHAHAEPCQHIDQAVRAEEYRYGHATGR